MNPIFAITLILLYGLFVTFVILWAKHEGAERRLRAEYRSFVRNPTIYFLVGPSLLPPPVRMNAVMEKITVYSKRETRGHRLYLLLLMIGAGFIFFARSGHVSFMSRIHDWQLIVGLIVLHLISLQVWTIWESDSRVLKYYKKVAEDRVVEPPPLLLEEPWPTLQVREDDEFPAPRSTTERVPSDQKPKTK